jgi:hypothetical protein
MRYDLRLRPAQPATQASDAFAVRRAEVPASPGRDGLSLAYLHDIAAYSRDVYLLVHDVLGHEHCGVVGGDVGPEFVHLCEAAFTNRAGPVVVPGAGRFLQWERADLFDALVITFFGDLRVLHELPV